jgi:hypothetical protein
MRRLAGGVIYYDEDGEEENEEQFILPFDIKQFLLI